MNMDSFEFPAKNYGDLAYRTYGKYFRWLVNSTQALQLLLSVGNIIISNGYVPFPLFTIEVTGMALTSADNPSLKSRSSACATASAA